MCSLFHADKSGVDRHTTEFALPIPITTRLITEKQWIAFPIAGIPSDAVTNVGKFTVNVVDVPVKMR